ncbi:hypothetical protein BDZ97DRAFT_1917787 [Flammula alnicola]|nr:hypothetical protein BDZ97DRAFT_1917787 [Flammula alnicola]
MRNFTQPGNAQALTICLPTLTDLSLDSPITEEYAFIDLLSSLPSLRELHIHDFPTNLHPDEGPSYLPNLEILSYKGILAVQAIDFIEPLIIRSRIRVPIPTHHLNNMAVLKQAKIKVDQDSYVEKLSIAEYTDSHYAWEIFRMVKEAKKKYKFSHRSRPQTVELSGLHSNTNILASRN